MSVTGSIEIGAARGQSPASARRRLGWVSARQALVILAGLALGGLALVLGLTREGAGVGGDSVWYLMGAENLQVGNGYSRLSGGGEVRPITGFPPLFSILLAGVGALGVPAMEGARLVNALLFASSLFLSGYLLLRVSNSSWAAILGVVLLLFTLTLVEIHSWVMSEPLYLVLTLLCVHSLSRGIAAADWRWIAFAGLAAAAASLTRYVGLSLVAGGAIALLALGSAGWRRRMTQLAAFVLIAGLPAGLWLVASASGPDALAGRQVGLRAMNPELLDSYKGELVSWVFAGTAPLPWRPRAILAALVALVGPFYFVVSRLARRRPQTMAPAGYPEVSRWVLVTDLGAFGVALVGNSLFLDAGTTLGATARYLAPAYVLWVLLSVSTVTELVTRTRARRLAGALGVTVVLAVIGLHLAELTAAVLGPGINLGYTAIRRDSPELVAALQAIEPERPIVTNNPELLYVLAERPAYLLPFRFDVYTQSERADYLDDIGATRARLESGGVLVILGAPDEQALQAMEDLNVTPVGGVAGTLFYGAAP